MHVLRKQLGKLSPEFAQQQSQQLAALKDMVDSKSTVISHQETRFNFLEEALRLSKQKRFAASSEKNLDQHAMVFDEAELAASDGSADNELPYGELAPDAEQSESSSRKKKKGRKGLSPDLVREPLYFYLSDEEKAGATETFFTKVKEELDIQPAVARVIEHYQEKAVFAEDDKRRIVSA